jgi:hypothetical protein
VVGPRAGELEGRLPIESLCGGEPRVCAKNLQAGVWRGDNLRARVAAAREFNRTLHVVVTTLRKARRPLEHGMIDRSVREVLPGWPGRSVRIRRLFEIGCFRCRDGRYVPKPGLSADLPSRMLRLLLRL